MSATERRELLHELAYAEVQASELFDQLDGNAACDTAADELAGAIARTISNWFARRLADSAEGERIEVFIELIAAVNRADDLSTMFPAKHPPLRSLREVQGGNS
jgi:hypothetical protein